MPCFEGDFDRLGAGGVGGEGGGLCEISSLHLQGSYMLRCEGLYSLDTRNRNVHLSGAADISIVL